MEWKEISDLREIVAKYLDTVAYYGDTYYNNADKTAIVHELHGQIKGFNLDEVSSLCAAISPHDSAILEWEGLKSCVHVFEELTSRLELFGDRVMQVDERAIEVRDFALKALRVFESELERMQYRFLHEPTSDDIKSAMWIDNFLTGKSMEKSISSVIEKYVFQEYDYDLGEIELNRRGEYLMEKYQANPEIVTEIKNYIEQRKQEIEQCKRAKEEQRKRTIEQRKQTTQTPKTKHIIKRELPSELDTEQARKYFARAVEAGLMSEQFEWLASQSLLACFCREMSVNLDLGKGYSSEGQKRLSWKPFEALFNVKAKNLTTSLNDIKKTGQDPIGIEKVEAIFKD